MSARVLILDGNTPEGTEKIVSLGGRPYGEGYADALWFFESGLDIIILQAATGEGLPPGVSLADFDGIAWTGSPLSAYERQPEVTRQIELAKAVHDTRVPCFGSCWGQQIMCQALGGEVRANPRGLEIGLARDIALTGAGKTHPMFAGKAAPFAALAIHYDEVMTLPEGATVLASNAMSRIQAMELAGDNGNFWAVQYHPEFDFALIALLHRRDEASLLRLGLYASAQEVQEVAGNFRTLHDDPADAEAIRKLEAGRQVLDPALRMAELGNWLKEKVLPRAAAKT